MTRARPEFARTAEASPYEPVQMPDGEGWLMRPVMRGLIKYESLIDGTLDLVDVLRCNDAIDVQDENEARMRAAIARKS